MKPKGDRYRICVDFDGVLHSYTTPWIAPETIPDPPVPGAVEWLNRMAADFDIVIFTTRAATRVGREAVLRWLNWHGCIVTGVTVTNRKQPALVYIDDRAWRFTGNNFPTKSEIHAARPWNKPE